MVGHELHLETGQKKRRILKTLTKSSINIFKMTLVM